MTRATADRAAELIAILDEMDSLAQEAVLNRLPGIGWDEVDAPLQKGWVALVKKETARLEKELAALK